MGRFDSIFKDEDDFQKRLANDLITLGFEVYYNKAGRGFKTFTGDQDKPDLIVYYKNYKRQNLRHNLSNPFFIECKMTKGGFNETSKAISQCFKYKNKKYVTEKGVVTCEKAFFDVVFINNDCYENGRIYNWVGAEGKPFLLDGIDWATERIFWSLYTLGIMKKQRGVQCWIKCQESIKDRLVIYFGGELPFYLIENGTVMSHNCVCREEFFKERGFDSGEV